MLKHTFITGELTKPNKKKSKAFCVPRTVLDLAEVGIANLETIPLVLAKSNIYICCLGISIIV